MVEYKVLLSPSHGGRRILRDNMIINTHANCQRLIASRFSSEWCRRSSCSHLIFVANTLTFGGRGEVQNLRTLWTRTNVLYSPIIHGSLRPPVSTDLKISKNMGTPASMTFVVCRNGLGNGQYLSVGSSSFPLKETSAACFSVWRCAMAQSQSGNQKRESGSIMQNETRGSLIAVQEMMKSRLGLKTCFPHEISNGEVMAPAAHEHH